MFEDSIPEGFGCSTGFAGELLQQPLGKAQTEAVSLLARKPPQNQKGSGQLAVASFPDPGFISWPLTLPENAKNCILEHPQHIFSFSCPDQWRIHWNRVTHFLKFPNNTTYHSLRNSEVFCFFVRRENNLFFPPSIVLWLKQLLSPDATPSRKLQMFLGHNGRIDGKSQCFPSLYPLPAFSFGALSSFLLLCFSWLGSIFLPSRGKIGFIYLLPTSLNILVIKGILYRWTYLQSRNRETDVENKHTDAKERRKGWINWELGIDIYTILCIK